MNNSQQSAFPIFLQDGLSHNSHVDTGLTKRELFAAMAMQGLLSNEEEAKISSSFILKFLGEKEGVSYEYDKHFPMYMAKVSVMFSDALINERSKQQQ